MSLLEARSIGPCLYELAPATRPDMRVPARVYADEALWAQIAQDRSLVQLINVATLPGVTGAVYGMPDLHEGYGFPVGGVAAMRISDGVISPGGVGYDINCGVRLLASTLQVGSLGMLLEPLVHDISRSVPTGAGRGGDLRLGDEEMDRVLAEGCDYLARRELATAEDLLVTETGGHLAEADPSQVSDRAKHRGRDQLGTLGGGNHFLEVEAVEELFDAEAAQAFGLREGQLAVLIHTGSRGLGHQVCTDYVRRMDEVMARNRIDLPDRELACAPIASPEGQAYLAAMSAAANFGWANRQTITHRVRNVFRRHLGSEGTLQLVYDVAHNMAKMEVHAGERLCVHRKGATRAFGPKNPETPTKYRAVGQPVLVPGSMGTASYVMAGTDTAAERSFGSSCHGAGRALSRAAAKRTIRGKEVRRELEARGIVVRCPATSELAEEAPLAYKDIERVVDVVHAAGLARKVARLRPLGVIKG
jgi:tRNA-splicing ligase RtcB